MRYRVWLLFLSIVAFASLSCSPASAQAAAPSQPQAEPPVKSRLDSIPSDTVKVSPQTDSYPPQLHSSEFEKPVPLSSAVNTAGAEDSPFVTPDGYTLYFFFTPDVRVPPEKQLLDGVTGVYKSMKQGGSWAPATRVMLQNKGELSLDGAVYVSGNKMWFASARRGNYRGVDLWTAELINGQWGNFTNAGKRLNSDYQAGEMHMSADSAEMYCHSDRKGGKGGLDIWVIKWANNDWQEPVNLSIVNTADNEGWPFLSQDGRELWFLRTYKGTPAIFRSKKIEGKWGEPELIVSQFAGEPTLDTAGNLYFVHHYFKDGKMIEADIYVAYKKNQARN